MSLREHLAHLAWVIVGLALLALGATLLQKSAELKAAQSKNVRVESVRPKAAADLITEIEYIQVYRFEDGVFTCYVLKYGASPSISCVR